MANVNTKMVIEPSEELRRLLDEVSESLKALAQLEESVLRVKRLTETAKLPSRGSQGAVGYDLHADLPQGFVSIMPGTRAVIPTGIAVAIPEGCYGRVAPRSGLALRHGLDVLAGVVDPDYRGEVMVILQNNGADLVTIARGDRIAQLILEACLTPEVEEVTDLDATERGEQGFGSTGQ
jgi:dUTP pyrophosphatase